MNNKNFTVGDIIRVDVSSVREYLPSDYYQRVHNKEGKIMKLYHGTATFIAEIEVVGEELPIHINKIFLRSVAPQQLMLFEL